MDNIPMQTRFDDISRPNAQNSNFTTILLSCEMYTDPNSAHKPHA